MNHFTSGCSCTIELLLILLLHPCLKLIKKILKMLKIGSNVKNFVCRFQHWDVNNEMLHGWFYSDRLKPGIRNWMFKAAHNTDPHAKLFVNDFDVLATPTYTQVKFTFWHNLLLKVFLEVTCSDNHFTESPRFIERIFIETKNFHIE